MSSYLKRLDRLALADAQQPLRPRRMGVSAHEPLVGLDHETQSQGRTNRPDPYLHDLASSGLSAPTVVIVSVARSAQQASSPRSGEAMNFLLDTDIAHSAVESVGPSAS